MAAFKACEPNALEWRFFVAGSGSEYCAPFQTSGTGKIKFHESIASVATKTTTGRKEINVEIVASMYRVVVDVSQALRSVHVECHAVNGIAPHYSAQFHQIELEVDVRVTSNISAMSPLVAYTNASLFCLIF